MTHEKNANVSTYIPHVTVSDTLLTNNWYDIWGPIHY